MTNLLVPPRKSSRPPPQAAAALRVQSSLAGQPRSIGWGLARLAGNLIGTWDWTATSYSESTQGGKGGGGQPVAGYTYTTAVAIGLSEGPIAGVRQMWTNKTPESLASLGFTLFAGGYGQGPWGYLVANETAYAQNFRGLAYAANEALSLGTSSTMPNLTFEARFAVSGAVTENATVPKAAPYEVTAKYFDITGNAAAEEITVPYAAPYAYQAENPGGLPYLQTDLVIGPSSGSIIGGPCTGVYYTDTDPPQFFTQVDVTPTEAGTYQVDSGSPYYYYFAPADAGANVTIVDLAVSAGVNYATPATGTLSQGSSVVTALSSPDWIAVGDPVVGANLAAGSVVQQVSGGSASGTVTEGSSVVAVTGGTYVATAGTPVSDSAGAIPAGTTITGSGGAVAILSQAAAGSGTEALNITVAVSGQFDSNNPALFDCTLTGIAVGAAVTDEQNYLIGGTTVLAVNSEEGWVELSNSSSSPGLPDTIYCTATVTGTVSKGSTAVYNLSDETAFIAGAAVTDQLDYLPNGTSVSSSSGTSLILSASATKNASGDVLTFPAQMTLSQAALADAKGAALTIVTYPFQQVTGTPAAGEFQLTPQGVYTFAAADAGKAIVITDVADANPADVVRDFLTNPYYGVPLFPAERLGDLSGYEAYCKAAGLWVSPVLASQEAATQLLQDLMTATNSALVWGNGGKLTVVPYGDAALNANGAAWSPPSQPIYSLEDDDFLPNQATNSSSVSAADSPDPVTVTRLDPAEAANDVQVEYLDRAQDYNPVIAEAQDDAAINLYGLKPSGSKQLHLLCDRSAAILSAELQLGRQQVRNLYSFTIDRKYILLDPMDIIALTDEGLGLDQQWVRIREITENDDRSLSIVAEEYLAGTGSAPAYGRQQGKGSKPNDNVDPGNALAPIFMDVPAALVQTLGCEGWIATNGGPLWGGCQVWLSSDNVSFHYAGTLNGGSTMGVTTADFPAGSDPDTADTCSIDLTESRGSLVGGTQADADDGNTACYVCPASGAAGEYFSYEQATLTAQYKYALGKYGSNAGYLRRGLFGSAIADHQAGSLFVRLRHGSMFRLPYVKSQIGNTVYVKLLSFNLYGGGLQSLADVTSYAHTIGGDAPALSEIGALALSSDLSPGAATTTSTGSGEPGGANSSGTTMVVPALSGVSGSVVLHVSGFFGPGEGSPAASEVTLSIARILSSGTTTIYTGQPIALPSSGNISFSFSVLDTPDPSNGDVTYEVIGTSNQGIAPFGPTIVTILQSRR